MENKDVDRLHEEVKSNTALLKEIKHELDAMKKEIDKIHHAVLHEHVSHGKKWASTH